MSHPRYAGYFPSCGPARLGILPTGTSVWPLCRDPLTVFVVAARDTILTAEAKRGWTASRLPLFRVPLFPDFSYIGVPRLYVGPFKEFSDGGWTEGTHALIETVVIWYRTLYRRPSKGATGRGQVDGL